ncbi:hypothetical protein IMG5_193760 [Ichthyophthirius multifiliis]|uniref:Transmembrane protein n=1 Tax=Ichthyophthirius multifiliis TaxID=5932 RepID=G0R4L6_ICHMU|nr:hypothetical protein IMG5_193760 [Ichthyophthirius multifiliis]EGR27576.1 hypothetical protein IMG5_193760 [Ichthyophthirius multifiliis]|eukprot:XP_004025028.1 hypothetical protein IMG5_193760 [Ichthyophthirius multifiliis]
MKILKFIMKKTIFYPKKVCNSLKVEIILKIQIIIIMKIIIQILNLQFNYQSQCSNFVKDTICNYKITLGVKYIIRILTIWLLLLWNFQINFHKIQQKKTIIILLNVQIHLLSSYKGLVIRIN